jgi:hypothetical protein
MALAVVGAGRKKTAIVKIDIEIEVVHYNEWANFGRKDFTPVVPAFKELLTCFRCEDCDSWMYVTPRGIPESLRCACSAISINLKSKK